MTIASLFIYANSVKLQYCRPPPGVLKIKNFIIFIVGVDLHVYCLKVMKIYIGKLLFTR